MKINKLKINGYGKLQNKEIELNDNINIIYGKNESGKSTILKFIINSFYGASKNKKGREISDYERYLPWDIEEFSGKVNYQLDNGESFEIYREFKKKNPKIFNELSEDISKQFNIDKNTGSEFFYEQTKVDEETFLSTAIIEQQEVKINKNIQNNLIQKISNLVSTGKENTSYKKAIEKINKKQLEEIGTERSREKPLNVIKARLNTINDEINTAQRYGNEGKEIEEKINQKKRNTLHNTQKIEILQDIDKIQREEKIVKEKIKINEKIKNDQQEKINLLKKEEEKIINSEKNKLKLEIRNKLEKNKKIKNKINIKLILFFIILLIINILQYFLIKNKIINIIFLLTVPTFLIFSYFFKKIKNNKIKIEEKDNLEKNKLIESKIENIKNEINLIEKNKNEIENEIKKIKIENNLLIKNKIEKIKNKYENIKIKNLFLDEEIKNYKNIKEENLKKEFKIEEILQLENLEEVINNLQQKQNKNQIDIANLEMKKSIIDDEKNQFEKLEEERVMLTEKYKKLCKKNESINIAKHAIEQAYETMKKSVSPRFTESLCNTVSKITNGRHNNIKLNDEEGLIVELSNGNYVNINRLSIGTIDQLYLSLRLAILEEISTERIPIILDESFAYYDDERLKNILEYLYKENNNRQILIFTCTNREKEILNKLNIEYNLVVL